jgi:hypothetical protein
MSVLNTPCRCVKCSIYCDAALDFYSVAWSGHARRSAYDSSCGESFLHPLGTILSSTFQLLTAPAPIDIKDVSPGSQLSTLPLVYSPTSTASSSGSVIPRTVGSHSSQEVTRLYKRRSKNPQLPVKYSTFGLFPDLDSIITWR